VLPRTAVVVVGAGARVVAVVSGVELVVVSRVAAGTHSAFGAAGTRDGGVVRDCPTRAMLASAADTPAMETARDRVNFFMGPAS
jgi:hypothetical protein